MADRHTGIRLNEDYDLDIRIVKDSAGMITRGLVVGDTTYQNQALLLGCQKGEIKEYPTAGVGLNDVINDHDFEMWKRSITEQFEADGMLIKQLKLNEKGLTLEAKYKNDKNG